MALSVIDPLDCKGIKKCAGCGFDGDAMLAKVLASLFIIPLKFRHDYGTPVSCSGCKWPTE